MASTKFSLEVVGEDKRRPDVRGVLGPGGEGVAGHRDDSVEQTCMPTNGKTSENIVPSKQNYKKPGNQNYKKLYCLLASTSRKYT